VLITEEESITSVRSRCTKQTYSAKMCIQCA